MPASRPPTVLHVIESFGGGSANAMRQFVAATPEARHVLLRAVRAGEYVADDRLAEFAAVHELPSGTLRRIATVQRVVRSVRPDVIHAHSSIAGGLTRLAVRARRGRPLYYSPHCFAFERRDLAPPVRGVVLAAEWLLGLNTTRVAACSSREATVARWLPPSRRPLLVPNTAGRIDRRPASSLTRGGVVGVGRIGAQKDPAFFLAVIVAARRSTPDLAATWIGDGDTDLVRRLRDGGVEVTGWLTANDVTDRLDHARVYLHTAAWEGFPLSILEANARGLAIVARRIPALATMPAAWLGRTAEDCASELLTASTDDRSNRTAWDAALASNSPARQRSALRALYGINPAR